MNVKNYKKCLIAIPLLLISINLIAQDLSADSADFVKYKVKQMGIGIPQVYNKFLSPLIYSGLSLNVYNENKKFSHFGLIMNNTSFGVDLMTNKISDQTILHFDYKYDYVYTPLIFKSETGDISHYIGPNGNANAVVEIKGGNTNNALCYKLLTSLDLSYFGEWNLGKRRHLLVSDRIIFPIVAFISTSGYTTILPEGTLEDEYENSDEFYSFYFIGQNTGFRNYLNFEFQLFKKKKGKSYSTWRFTYLFEGNTLNAPNEWSYVKHTFLLGRVFKLYNL